MEVLESQFESGGFHVLAPRSAVLARASKRFILARRGIAKTEDPKEPPMAEMPYRELLTMLIARGHLTREQAESAFDQIMTGAWSEGQIAGLLVALAAKGETVDEIAGAASAMRAHCVKVDGGGRAVIDTCGTGGTGLNTFNISTAAALVAAGAGACVAKHGNRTNTRASGSADVLGELGVNLDAGPEIEARCLAEAGVCFLFAQRHHPAMKHAGPVRKALAVRTIFNVLGPLTNPAGARRQLMGVFDDALVEPIAQVLAALGSERAMVVHAEDGLDEISTAAPTRIADLADGRLEMKTVRPEDFGMPTGKLADLAVASPAESAERVRGVLGGKMGSDRDIVVLNAAAALAVSGNADDIPAGVRLAEQSIDEGNAAAALETLVRVSNS
jgi:anthranilate phosphoribosyltransferase